VLRRECQSLPLFRLVRFDQMRSCSADAIAMPHGLRIASMRCSKRRQITISSFW
jgi:hypothetical protein